MVYFDNAATTFPKPRQVLNAVNSAVSYYGGNPGHGGHDMAMRVAKRVFEVRKKMADFFNANEENIIFTQNCTMALNIAIKGLAKKSSHIICSCLEHNAVIRPIHKLFCDDIITYDIADVCNTEEETVKSFEKLIKSDTDMIVCTHASNVTGKVLPIEKIGRLCKEKGVIFIVDAAQTAGVIPIDIKKCNINILCMPGHKGLYGVTGTGALILNDIDKIDTINEGGTGSSSVDLVQPDFFPDRLEAGTLNTIGILSLGAGIDFINELTMDKIYSHEKKLCYRVYKELKNMKGIALYEDYDKGNIMAPIVSFNVKAVNSDSITDRLNKLGFALRGGLHCSPLAHNFYGTIDMGMARFSPSVFTKEQEVDIFLMKLYKLIKNL